MSPIVGALLLLVPPFPLAGQVETVEGTWLLTQGVDLGLAAGEGPDLQLPIAYELPHLDRDKEVREQSTLFRPETCGREIPVGNGLWMTLPFSAEPGIGHWSCSGNVVKVSSYHLLYDCSGNPLGVAWQVREASAVSRAVPYGAEGASDETALRVVAWQGETTIRFFTLTGEPLPLPLFFRPLFPGTDSGVSELSGSFRAVRAFGEPARQDPLRPEPGPDPPPRRDGPERRGGVPVPSPDPYFQCPRTHSSVSGSPPCMTR